MKSNQFDLINLVDANSSNKPSAARRNRGGSPASHSFATLSPNVARNRDGVSRSQPRSYAVRSGLTQRFESPNQDRELPTPPGGVRPVFGGIARPMSNNTAAKAINGHIGHRAIKHVSGLNLTIIWTIVPQRVNAGRFRRSYPYGGEHMGFAGTVAEWEFRIRS